MRTENQIIDKIRKLQQENRDIDSRLQKEGDIQDWERKDYTENLVAIVILNWVLT